VINEPIKLADTPISTNKKARPRKKKILIIAIRFLPP
jgi:hypothetical protein